jgi:hypothetical protein
MDFNKQTTPSAKNMNTKFDELTKAIAQSVTRRAALKKFGVGLAGMALAAFGFANNARADKVKTCATEADCSSGQVCCQGTCWDRPAWCDSAAGCCCYCAGHGKNRYGATALTPCDPSYNTCSNACLAESEFFGCL